MSKLLPEVQAFAERLELSNISAERKNILCQLINFIQEKVNKQEDIKLNFICTHNSRRSQLCQVWAQAAAIYFGIEGVSTFSGGTEVTAFHPNAVKALESSGVIIRRKDDGPNPLYYIRVSENVDPMTCFSKVYHDNISPYAAVMTCSDAETNCPYIPEAEARLAVKYEDPKKSDGTPQEVQTYAERSRQIASEMFYVFSKIKK